MLWIKRVPGIIKTDYTTRSSPVSTRGWTASSRCPVDPEPGLVGELDLPGRLLVAAVAAAWSAAAVAAADVVVVVVAAAGAVGAAACL